MTHDVQRKTVAVPSKSAVATHPRQRRGPGLGNQVVQRLLGNAAVQAKLTVNRSGDVFEQEADRLADQALAAPGSSPASAVAPRVQVRRMCEECEEEAHDRQADVQRCAACDAEALHAEDDHVHRMCAECEAAREEGGTAQRLCAECEEKAHGGVAADVQRCAACHAEAHRDSEQTERRARGGVAERGSHPELAEEQLGAARRHGGRELPESVRAFFEPRFGRDFGAVRIHMGPDADAAARSINALAFTIGRDIVFRHDSWAPGTAAGARLLAHELAHTVQQGHAKRSGGEWATSPGGPEQAVVAPMIQRATCPPAPTGLGAVPLDASADCSEATRSVTGMRFSFCFDSDVMDDEGEARFGAAVPTLVSQDVVEVHGFASPEGPVGQETQYNLNLSCRRAHRAADMLAANGVPRSKIRIFKHGGSIQLGSRAENRAVVISSPALAASAEPARHRVRVAGVSFLACAGCNPFTDDGPVALSPPASEPTSGFRMKHEMEAEIVTPDGIRIDPASPGIVSSAHTPGTSGFCGVHRPAFVVGTVSPSAPFGASTPRGESWEWESEFASRVSAIVPATLPLAPCDDIGPNPAIPPISNRFGMRIHADGTVESWFRSASTYPFHYLYENGSLKRFGGAPVRPTVDFTAWALSTVVPSVALAEAGFKAMKIACCAGGTFPGCSSRCIGGVSVPDPTRRNLISCGRTAHSLLSAPCPAGCAPAGAVCSPPRFPSNP